MTVIEQKLTEIEMIGESALSVLISKARAEEINAHEINGIIALYKRKPAICLQAVKRIGLTSFINQAKRHHHYSDFVEIVGHYKAERIRCNL